MDTPTIRSRLYFATSVHTLRLQLFFFIFQPIIYFLAWTLASQDHADTPEKTFLCENICLLLAIFYPVSMQGPKINGSVSGTQDDKTERI
jgi:hypothetical protein